MLKRSITLTLLLFATACSPGVRLQTIAAAVSSGVTIVAIEDKDAMSRGIEVSKLDVHWNGEKAIAEAVLLGSPGIEAEADILWHNEAGAPVGRSERFVQHVKFDHGPRVALLWEAPVPQAVTAEIVISLSSNR